MSTGSLIEFKIVIPSLLFDTLTSEEKLILDFAGEEQIRLLKLQIVDLLSNVDGAPEIEDLNIRGYQFNEEIKRGSFRLVFRISRFFCCSDISAANNDYVDFEFEYTNEIMTAHGNFFQWTLDN